MRALGQGGSGEQGTAFSEFPCWWESRGGRPGKEQMLYRVTDPVLGAGQAPMGPLNPVFEDQERSIL